MNAIDLSQRLASAVDPSSGNPVAHQIVEQVWLEVVEGAIETGQRMPTVRELAIRLGVSPRSVRWAYDELERRGVAATRPEGTFISLAPASNDERKRTKEFLSLCADTVQRIRALGFGVDEFIAALREFRAVDRAQDREGEHT